MISLCNRANLQISVVLPNIYFFSFLISCSTFVTTFLLLVLCFLLLGKPNPYDFLTTDFINSKFT